MTAGCAASRRVLARTPVAPLPASSPKRPTSINGRTSAPPEMYLPEVCSFRLPQMCGFRLPLTSAPLRRKRAVAHDVETQFSTVVTPALGAGHPVDRVHRSRVPGGNPRFSPKISEVKATDQQRPAQAPPSRRVTRVLSELVAADVWQRRRVNSPLCASKLDGTSERCPRRTQPVSRVTREEDTPIERRVVVPSRRGTPRRAQCGCQVSSPSRRGAPADGASSSLGVGGGVGSCSAASVLRSSASGTPASPSACGSRE